MSAALQPLGIAVLNFREHLKVIAGTKEWLYELDVRADRCRETSWAVLALRPTNAHGERTMAFLGPALDHYVSAIDMVQAAAHGGGDQALMDRGAEAMRETARMFEAARPVIENVIPRIGTVPPPPALSPEQS